MQEMRKIPSKDDPELLLRVIPGHFSSDRFHINYYIDMSYLKMRRKEAVKVAQVMSKKYVNRVDLNFMNKNKYSGLNWDNMAESMANVVPIDTIICMDGCEVIGAYMAEEMAAFGVRTLNKHQSFYVISPEFDSSGQMVVRDNIRSMIKNKNVLVILASAMSGRTISKSLKCIKAYGGNVCGVSVIFGAVSEIDGCPVNAVFTENDLPDFKLSEASECEQCKANVPLDAIVNSYGYSEL